MKKLVLFILVLALGANLAMAQEAKVENDSVNKTEIKTKADKKKVTFPRSYIGIRGGANISDMIYSSPNYDCYTHTLMPNAMLGVFGHFQLGKSHFAIRPEISYVRRSDSLYWYDVRYSMRANYLDFRLPITYNIVFRNSHFSPYLMIVPQYNMAIGGSIYYRDDFDFPNGDQVDLSKANINQFDGAMMFGLGFDYLIETKTIPMLFSLEAGYNMGFHNTFAPREIIDNPNVPAGNSSIIHNNFFGKQLWHETRNNRGIEIAMRLALPIDGSWRKKKEDIIVQQIIDSIILSDTIILRDTVRVHDTLTIINTQKDTTHRIRLVTDTARITDTTGYVLKDCYDIRHMRAFLTLGMSIKDKRICMPNIKFDFDKYIIRPVSYKHLNELAELLVEFPELEIQVIGHTDSCGTDAYNETLSLNRAKEVVNYLSKRGVSKVRMEAIGYGERFPIDDNGTDEGRLNNRRVEIEIKGMGINLTSDQTDTSSATPTRE